ncbi:hypothetical protein TL16_g04762 [Triparma laevis f. inornata]|uniref:Uncharacterized protein n=1 Tax=Triparma laevis f. inornata TaxID=1714386 RepID=A0A9W7AE85_9STRA|nr:hypothetical protein TL16_g04762 [Triparma laevis f. inornata]
MFSSSNNPRLSSASHSAPFSLSFTHMTKMSNYSALTDPHCILTRSTNFRQHFANLVGPYSLAASLCVKPNLDLDYSKKSVRDRVRPMTANGATRGETAPSSRKKPPPTLRTNNTNKNFVNQQQTYKPYHKQGGGLGAQLDVPLSPEDVSDFRNPKPSHSRPKSAHFRKIDPTSPMGSPVTDMKSLRSLRSRLSPFESALKQEKIKRRTLQLFLSGRRALLGEYRISAGETLSDLRDFVQANLEYYWSKSFTFAYRDGVEISESHESRLSLADFVKNEETRCGVAIVPVHTRRTKRRQSTKMLRKTKKSASSSRLAKKFNEAKTYEAHDKAFGKDLQDAKSVVTDYDVKHPEHKNNLRDRANTMKKYEDVKERIAVSYLANVERNRADARTELLKIMNIAALKIQNMHRCSKAKSFVEDVLLQLHAASVLQGIVRRGQSSAVAAKKKKERDDVRAEVRQKALEESKKREKAHNRLHNARNPRRRDKPVHCNGLRTRFAFTGAKTSKGFVKVEKKNAIVSIFESHLATSESCYRVRVTDPRENLNVESEVEFKGDGFDNVRIGLDKQIDEEYFSKACECLVVILSDNDEGLHRVIFDGEQFYSRVLLHSEAIRVRRKEKYVIDIHQEQGIITVGCTCTSTGDLEQQVISPRHLDTIKHEAEEGAPKLVSDVSKREIFALKVISHVHINEEGAMTVDFDLKIKEVILYTACKKLDGVNCHVKINRCGDLVKILVLDPAYDNPMTTELTDWNITGLSSSFSDMSKDDVLDLCLMIVQRIMLKPGEGVSTMPSLMVDLDGMEKPVRIVTEAMHLLGQKFIVNCYRLGPSLILDATGMMESTKYSLEVDESDWQNTGYGPLNLMHGIMGKKEQKVVELCRRILENTYMQKTTSGQMQLSLDFNMLRRKCLHRGGLFVDDMQFRIYVFDSSKQDSKESSRGSQRDLLSLNRQSLASVSGTVLQIKAENMDTEERLNLDVPYSEWQLGIRNKLNKERVAKLRGGSNLDFSKFEEEMQDEILDYIMENLNLNHSGQLFVDHKGTKLKKCLMYTEDLVLNGKKGHRVRILMQGSDKIIIYVIGEEEDEDEDVSPIVLDDEGRARFMTFMDVKNDLLDFDAVISSIYLSDEGVPSFSPDLKRPLIDIEVQTADNTTLHAIVTQRGDGLEFRVSEQDVRINFRRVLYPISWRNTGYNKINELAIEDVKVLANVCCQTLARNKMQGRDGNEKQIVQWDLGLEIDKVREEEGKETAGCTDIERRESVAFFDKTHQGASMKLTLMKQETVSGKLN